MSKVPETKSETKKRDIRRIDVDFEDVSAIKGLLRDAVHHVNGLWLTLEDAARECVATEEHFDEWGRESLTNLADYVSGCRDKARDELRSAIDVLHCLEAGEVEKLFEALRQARRSGKGQA